MLYQAVPTGASVAPSARLMLVAALTSGQMQAKVY
jgi:hypothetical protein